MKRCLLLFLLVVYSAASMAQTESHNTMFMFNKLFFNPAYAGSKEVTSVGAYYRNQWSGIAGAPKSYGAMIDAPIGRKDQPFRSIALGLSFNNEQIGVERKQNVTGYYSFRIQLKNESIVSFGLQGGAQLYSASYSQLNPYQQYDPNLSKDIKSAMLPNFGAGIFWYSEDFYLGASIPNSIQNYYDKNERNRKNIRSQQVRGYYLNAGRVFHAGEDIDILPQAMLRYAGNATYQLPVNCDINLSFICYKRVLFGVTYRTDKSIEAIAQMQVSKKLNIGYSYDYLISGLAGYNNGAHEIVIGFDFIKEDYSYYDKPHFVKSF